jgi:hypothetical protein
MADSETLQVPFFDHSRLAYPHESGERESGKEKILDSRVCRSGDLGIFPQIIDHDRRAKELASQILTEVKS